MAQRLPATLMLALTCHFFASLLGISFGVLAATQQYRWTDTLGKIVEQGPVEQVLSSPRTEYTRRLVRAVLDIAD